MKTTKRKAVQQHLPAGVEVGQHFLLRFDDPRIEACTYQGRLQQLSRDGLLCFDAPEDLRPARGTPVTIRSLPSQHDGCAFASEIRGRGRLGGRVPVLLVEPPVKATTTYRRSSYRVNVCLRGRVEWRPARRLALRSAEAVLTNIGGGGAQLYLRHQPTAEWIEITVDVPRSFVEEQARRHLPRSGVSTKSLSLTRNPVAEAGERVAARFSRIRARTVSVRLHTHDARGPVYALSVAFRETQEGCYHLVRYLERQALRRGVRGSSDEAENPSADSSSTSLATAA